MPRAMWLGSRAHRAVSGGFRPQVTLTVAPLVLRGEPGEPCELDGAVITPESARRIACDATITRIAAEDGRVLDVGRTTRTIPSGFPGWRSCCARSRSRVPRVANADAATSRTHLPARTVAQPRGRRAGHPHLHRLVQPSPDPRTDRRHPTRRIRSQPLPSGEPSYVTSGPIRIATRSTIGK